MKTGIFIKTILTANLLALLTSSGFAQLATGGILANFGVDADTRANSAKLGPSTGIIVHDDWFSTTSGTGRAVLDTSNASTIKASLKGDANLAFTKTMSVPLYTRVNSRLWLDAAYSRDFHRGPSASDSNAFTTMATNGDDPANWGGGIDPGVPDKNDIVDVFVHMRRNGNTIADSLWLFSALSTNGTLGDRHLDVEFYKIPVNYSRTTGSFTSGGPDMGHTQWIFDASGNITQTGDMIITVSYSATGTITTEVRIWVARTTYNTTTPALFNFGSNYNGKTAVSAYGYASIVSKTGSSNFGAGIGNLTATPANDTTFNTPWGSRSLVTGVSSWDSVYRSLQFVEVGLNLTRIGLDPGQYGALGTAECDPMFRTVLFKSRSANAFTASLQDFVGPIDFMRTPSLDHSIQNDTLTCTKTVGTLRVTSNTTGGFYQWQTPTGAMVTATSLGVNKTGTYVLHASIASGCAVGKRDTLRVIADSLMPVATASVGANAFAQTQLFGGDPVASNYATPFGGSQGLTYSWVGPNTFTSTLRNPIIGTMDTGMYTITVTERRNGCRRSASVYYGFSVLADDNLSLSASSSGNKIQLQWKNTRREAAGEYIIEKVHGGDAFKTIGKTRYLSNVQQYTYTDVDVSYTDKLYRVKMVNADGKVYYSNEVMISNSPKQGNGIYLTNNYDRTSLSLVVDSKARESGSVIIYNINGDVIKKQPVAIEVGKNTIAITNYQVKPNSMQVVVLFIDGQVAFTEKLLNF